jgi:hypothetical protein
MKGGGGGEEEKRKEELYWEKLVLGRTPMEEGARWEQPLPTTLETLRPCFSSSMLQCRFAHLLRPGP